MVWTGSNSAAQVFFRYRAFTSRAAASSEKGSETISGIIPSV